MLPAIALRLNGLQNKYPFFNWRNVRFDENSLALFFLCKYCRMFQPDCCTYVYDERQRRCVTPFVTVVGGINAKAYN